MSRPADRVLVAVEGLLRSSRTAGPDDVPALLSAAAAQLGAAAAVLYLVDYDQTCLVSMDRAATSAAIPIEGTLAGRAFSDMVQHASTAGAGVTLWTPVLDGTDRLGVLQLEFADAGPIPDELRGGCADVAALLAQLVVSKALYGDAVERTRRRSTMSIPAEMQWRLLPPLTFMSPHVSIAGVLVPTEDVAGDSFDYALNGDTLHVAIVDAMGHGLRATLLAGVAVSALRHARRATLGLATTASAIESALSSQFGLGQFVTAILGELDVSTGWWRWITCGHPPALLIRDGHVVKELGWSINPPLGLGLLPGEPREGKERLQPGDRLLLHSDGVVEARNESGEFFGTKRLVDFITRQAAGERPAAETLRRLNHAILDHQHGLLQDDATIVLIDWLTNPPPSAAPSLR